MKYVIIYQYSSYKTQFITIEPDILSYGHVTPLSNATVFDNFIEASATFKEINNFGHFYKYDIITLNEAEVIDIMES